MVEPIKSTAPWSTSIRTGDPVHDARQAYGDWEKWLQGKFDEYAPDDEPALVDELAHWERMAIYSAMRDLVGEKEAADG